MISQWIASLESGLEVLSLLVFQFFHLGFLVFCYVFLLALNFLPAFIAYWAYLKLKETPRKSPPASVTGQPSLPDRTAQSPPVAGVGGETG